MKRTANLKGMRSSMAVSAGAVHGHLIAVSTVDVIAIVIAIVAIITIIVIVAVVAVIEVTIIVIVLVIQNVVMASNLTGRCCYINFRLATRSSCT